MRESFRIAKDFEIPECTVNDWLLKINHNIDNPSLIATWKNGI